MIVFEVFGKPQTQGSTRVVPMPAAGGGYQTDAKGRPRLIPIHAKDKELRAWRQDVAAAARRAYGDGPLLEGPILLSLQFQRPRPKGHFGSGRNAGRLKASVPGYPTTRPDAIKLTRAVEDALTGVLWQDDSQIVEHWIAKRWGQSYRLVVKVQPLSPAGPESSSQSCDSTSTPPGA